MAKNKTKETTIGKERTKRILSGIGAAVTHYVSKITIPALIFGWLVGRSVGGINLGYTQNKIDVIIYFITAFGLVSTGLSFFKASSPKDSPRKAFAELIMYFWTACYIYTYRLSGAFNFENVVIPISPNITARFNLNMDVMIYVSMALAGLNMIVALYDIIVAFATHPKNDIILTQSTNSSSKKMKEHPKSHPKSGVDKKVDAYDF